MTENTIVSQGNEVIIPSSGESPEDIARASVVRKKGIILGGDLNIIKTNEDVNPIFLAYNISNSRQKKELSKRAQGKSIVHLHNSDLMQIIFIYPNIQEQNKIGAFFKKIDDTIALHQRKLEKIELLQKEFMCLMFPQKGESNPKLKFTNFTSKWEKHKLGDISKMYQPKTISQSDFTDNGIPVFGANGYIGYFTKENHNLNQVTISARGEKAGTPNFVKAPVWITGNSMVINIDNNENLDKYFLYQSLKATPLKKYVTGGAQPQLTREVLLTVPVNLTSIDEQKEVSCFFNILDTRIELQKSKINNLTKLKNKYLRMMFV